MIMLFFLDQSIGPIPTNMVGLFRGEDTPAAIMPANVLKSVKTALTISPEGKIQDCRAEVSGGIPQLDAHTCKLLTQRARFRPAGTPTYAVYRTQINWWVGDGYPPKTRTLPDLALTVSALPPKTKSPAIVRVMFRVDESGQTSDCSAEDKKGNPTLVKLGCEQLIKSYAATPARTLAGAPVASVQMPPYSLKPTENPACHLFRDVRFPPKLPTSELVAAFDPNWTLVQRPLSSQSGRAGV